MIYKYACKLITVANILSANLSKYLCILHFLTYKYTCITHVNIDRIKIALELLFSDCLLISWTNKCLNQRCKIFRNIWQEPQISRRHNGNMKQATGCGPANISATLHNLVAHDLWTPDLSYNNTSAPICVCRLPPVCKILSVIIGSRLKLHYITQFSPYRTENTVPILYKFSALSLFKRIIGIWCKKNKKYNTMWKNLGI